MTSLSNDTAVHCTGVQLRHVYHIVIGVNRKDIPPYRIDAAFRDLQDQLTRLTGGITGWNGDGTWTARSQQGDYSGPIERDAALNIIVTLTDADKQVIWPQIKTVIASTVYDHDLGCDHIHVMVWAAQSAIFCVSDAELNTVPSLSSDVTPANQNHPHCVDDDVTMGKVDRGDTGGSRHSGCA